MSPGSASADPLAPGTGRNGSLVIRLVETASPSIRKSRIQNMSMSIGETCRRCLFERSEARGVWGACPPRKKRKVSGPDHRRFQALLQTDTVCAIPSRRLLHWQYPV